MHWGMNQDWTTQASAVNVTAVTPAQNSKGSYQQLISSTNNDSYVIEVRCSEGYSGATARDIIVDIGIDYAAGSSYSVFIADLLASCAAGVAYRFPVFIPSGCSLAARASVNNATVGTIRVNIKLYQKPRHPELLRYGFVVDSIGVTSASSSGTAITPGASGAEGTWTQLLASLSHDYFWWEVGLGVNDATITQRTLHADLSCGDSTNKQILVEHVQFETSASETVSKGSVGNEAVAPSGNTLYGRVANSGTNDSGYSMMAYGVRC